MKMKKLGVFIDFPAKGLTCGFASKCNFTVWRHFVLTMLKLVGLIFVSLFF